MIENGLIRYRELLDTARKFREQSSQKWVWDMAIQDVVQKLKELEGGIG